MLVLDQWSPSASQVALCRVCFLRRATACLPRSPPASYARTLNPPNQQPLFPDLTNGLAQRSTASLLFT